MSDWWPMDRLKKVEWNRANGELRVWHKGKWHVYGERVSAGSAEILGYTFLNKLRRGDEETDTTNGVA